MTTCRVLYLPDIPVTTQICRKIEFPPTDENALAREKERKRETVKELKGHDEKVKKRESVKER